jgi:beta-1,2-mannobiose phosphorylase / 1,2-beta-oligomannan phosphorylase
MKRVGLGCALIAAAWLLGGMARGAESGRPSEMHWADESRLGRPFSKDPSVVRFRDRYLMYFSLPPFSPERAVPGSPKGWGIGIAESRDLRQWHKTGEIAPEQEIEKNGICAPGARVLGGQVHLFYQTYGNGPRDAICHAVSDDGIRFTKDPSNPVFRPEGPWTAGRAIDAEAFPVGSRLLLYFATRDPQMKIQMIGVAAAPLDSDYGRTAWRQLVDGPILKPELPWEQECIEAPTMCARDGKLYMFYAGAYNNKPQQIGVAVSSDGIAWKRISDRPLVPNGPPGSWNSSESGHPGVFVDRNGETFLFYQGNNDAGKSWFLSQLKIRWRGGIPEIQ